MFHKMEKLQEAIRNDDVAQVKKIRGKMILCGTKEYYDLCVLAVQNNKSNALEALLEYWGFNFTSERYDKSGSRKLLDEALSSPDPIPLLSVLYDVNKKADYGRRLDTKDFINKDTPFDFIKVQLKKDLGLSADCIYAVLDSTERLGTVLDLASESGNRQSILDNALVYAAGVGNIDAARMLLERQANPNYGDARALLNACENGHQDMVALLLPLVRRALCGYVALQLQRKDSASEAVISSLEAAAQKTAVPRQPQEATDDFIREGDNAISQTQTLTDGTRIKNLFNFLVQEKQTIVETPGCPMPGVSITPFGQLGDGIVEEMRKIQEVLGEKNAPIATPRLAIRLR